MKKELIVKVEEAIISLCEKIQHPSSKQLLAIGFITTDAVQAIAAKFLFEGELEDDAEAYLRLSPVEWTSSNEDAFVNLNSFLASPKNIEAVGYSEWVSSVFDAFTATLSNLELRKKLGDPSYITFTGVDPNDELESAEKQFVKAMNSEAIFEEWCSEFD